MMLGGMYAALKGSPPHQIRNDAASTQLRLEVGFPELPYHGPLNARIRFGPASPAGR